MTNPTFRLLDFQVKNAQGKGKKGFDNKEFVIQMFGMNEEGETCSILVKDFTPFFYVKVGDDWGIPQKNSFVRHIKEQLRIIALKEKHAKWHKGIPNIYPTPEDDEEVNEYIARTKENYVSYYENSIVDSIILEREGLYGFDNMKQHRFICLKFKNTTSFNKVKNFWYTITVDPTSIFGKKYKLKTFGFKGTHTELYEAKLPPLLRYFHIQEINPSGWIELPLDKIINRPNKTYCKHEFTIKSSDIVPLPQKEDLIPAIVASWDIEASSSHGDFPLAIKSYRKLVRDIITYWKINDSSIRTKSTDKQKAILIKLIKTAFGFDETEDISKVFTKRPISEVRLMEKIYSLISPPLKTIIDKKRREEERERAKNDYRNRDDNDDDDSYNTTQSWLTYVKRKPLLDYLNDKSCDIGKKLEIIDEAVTYLLPPLEGDKVTFIGTTFMHVGDSEPYLNYMAVLGDCDEITIKNSETIIECFDTERDLLMGWTEMMREQHPDILIGYNTFGFDWKFVCERAAELNCMKPLSRYGSTPSDDEEEIWFSELSRNRNEFCRKVEKEIRIASGTHQLIYMDLPGIIQIDLYNYFRREVNLGSYKLNDVASHFIGDMISSWTKLDATTVIRSGNLMGLQRGNFVCFEMIGHSVDTYKNGKKFKVLQLDEEKGEFIVEGNIDPRADRKLRWGLGKDDITPHQIFELANGSASDRAIIAKYCFQDCNLVHHLFRKNDILTGMAEQASICSVPIDFVVMRGQGIKLLSFIAKKCRQKNTLMPVVEKPEVAVGYEGAICLKPKRGLYTENDVAVNDYSSLYPSCMISENISQDSKVWSKEYDFDKNLLSTTGETNKDGSFKYDNLDGYEYVDIEYDRYEWIGQPGKKKEEKVKMGTKICRFAQFPDDKKAIMPSTLQGLLAARKATRAKIKFKTVTLKNGETRSGLLAEKGDHYAITLVSLEDERLKNTCAIVLKTDVVDIKDTYNSFMKNVYNQRQASIKIVANSLYGGCGARTSAFYDIDIAASTTAMGRKLLIYAQRVIEEVYGDAICDTKYGQVQTNAEYIYGDSVTPDTPLLLRNKETGLIEFKQIDDLSNDKWQSYEGFKVNESNRREKQQNLVENYQIFTSKGWSNITRVIRHKTRKQIYRVTTHAGMVDVTEDHSLLDENSKIVKPTDVKIGMKLLHNYPKFEKKDIKLKDILDYIKNIGTKSLSEKKAFIFGFFYGDGSCGKYDCPSGVKYSWALNQKDRGMCVVLQNLLVEIYNESFKINDTIKSSGVYKIVPNCGNIKKYVEMYRPLFYNKDKYKTVPVDILNGEYDTRYAYFAGYYAADGSTSEKSIRMDNKGKIGSAMLYYLAKSIGFNVSINTIKDKLNITRLNCTSGEQRKSENVIKKVDLIGESNDFVYDIETETGNFNTGYGLIVKNTDSVFFTFHLKDMDGNKIKGKEALEITIDLAIEAGKLASKFLKPPHDLEYEKTFSPFLLLSKKRYVGILYETNPNKGKRKEMGIVLKRRDNAPIVKDIYGGLIDILMKEHDIPAAIAFVKDFLQDIVDEKFPLEKLIITKKLSSFYKNPQSIAHRVLADRMGKRDPGTKPSVGSRVPFVFIQTKTKVKLQGDRIESPAYIRINNIRPDYGHYITNQIMKPVQQVFALILEQIPSFKRKIPGFKRKCEYLKQECGGDEELYERKEDALRNKEVKKIIFDDVLRQANNIKNGQKSIIKWFG
jgi:DNA polymerase elongation subunit (family B)